MNRLLVAALLLLLVAAPAPAADRRAAAEELVDRLAAGEFAAVVAGFDATMGAALPEPKLREAWATIQEQAGRFKKRLASRAEVFAAYDIVMVTSQFEGAALDVKVVYDEDGKVAGLFFLPASTPAAADTTRADYVKPGAFKEVDVTVDSGRWKLPGTLAIPKGAGPFPALVLVHGSGPNDRNETIGPNRPFRDIAQGLASRGIAILRYDKRTRVYGEKAASGKLITVYDETIDDARAAVALLAGRAEIDRKRIIVLGHSLGGTLLPRIARGDDAIAGIVSLAGGARPIDEAMLNQFEWIKSLPGTSGAQKAAIEESEEAVRSLAALDPATADTTAVVLGAPVSYWLDLRRYRPADEAKGISKPMLFLQGERDYQVTMADFAVWRGALATRSDVTFKSYSDLNHLFLAGKGKATPAEYDNPGHVSAAVIDDIAGWILHGKP